MLWEFKCKLKSMIKNDIIKRTMILKNMIKEWHGSYFVNYYFGIRNEMNHFLSNNPPPPKWNHQNKKVKNLWWSPWKLNITRMHGSTMVEGDHEGNDKDSLFKHKHHKIGQIPSHISKAMANANNLETLIPWFYWIKNGM